jgi:hypothetical protein
MYYLLFPLASVLSALSFGQYFAKEEQSKYWPKGRADNTLAKRKSRQYTVQKEEQTIHWPKERADNTLAKRKSR